MGVSEPPAGAGPTAPAGGPVRRAAPAGGRRFGALRHRSFALLWGGLLLSNTGTWMQSTAQGYLVYELTSSPLALGLLGFSFALPMLVLPPLGGVVADRVDRLALLRVTNVLWIVLTLALTALTWTGAVSYAQI